MFPADAADSVADVESSFAAELDECKSDKDCPSSYCESYKSPKVCHTCGKECCLTNDDCAGKGFSYCMNTKGKKAPFFCHA